MQSNVVILPTEKTHVKIQNVLHAVVHFVRDIGGRVVAEMPQSTQVFEMTSLRRVLFGRHLTLRQVASKSGLSLSTISSIVYGKCVPSDDEALRIARAVGMNVQEMWNRLLFRALR